MTTWQRRLRIALGVFILLFAAGVYLAMRRPAAPAPPPERTRVDSKVQTQVEHGVHKEFRGAKLDYTIEYGTIAEYTAEATRIRDVKATFLQRNGRDYQITGDEALVSPDQSNFSIKGNVRFSSSDGLVLTMQDASYTKAEDVVRAPGKVDFARGNMHGSGTGMTYDHQRDLLSYADHFEMFATEKDGQPRSEIHATSAAWARGAKQMHLEGGVKIVRGGQTLESDAATANLTEDEEHIRNLELQGNARITGTPSAREPGPGNAHQEPGTKGQEPASTLRAMRAHDINLTYADDGATLQQAVLGGGSSVEVASTADGSITRIAGEFVEFHLEADGVTIRSLAARGAGADAPARLELPGQGDAPPRVIRAASVEGPVPGAGVIAGRGLTTMRFAGNAEYREMPPPPAEPRLATAATLDLTLEPGFGALDEARFAGNAHLKEGASLEASARDARYDVKAGSFEFTGPDDRGRPPHVKDQDQANIQASRIVVKPDGRKVSAVGTVQTTIQPAQKRPNGTTTHTPGILSADQPAFATSDELEYDGAASHADFTSKRQCKLWQEQGNKIYALRITVDDATGDLSAGGGVLSVMKLDQTDTKTKRTERVDTTVTADAMVYTDSEHRATYTGHVEMKGGPQGNMEGDRAVLFLTPDARALDRLEAYDHVQLEDEGTPTTGHRTVTGDRLLYTAADECYKVTGKLVKIDEECFGETQGRALTFYRSVDRIIVDGNAERRTQTKGGQGCKKKEPHFD